MIPAPAPEADPRPAAIAPPVDLAAPSLPVAGGVTALVVGALHMLIALILLVGGIIAGATGPLVGGAIYAAIVAITSVLAGLMLRGRRAAAIAVGVIFAVGAGFCLLGLIGLLIKTGQTEQPGATASAAVALLSFLIPSLLCFRDARRLRQHRAATIDNLKAAFQ